MYLFYTVKDTLNVRQTVEILTGVVNDESITMIEWLVSLIPGNIQGLEALLLL